MHNIFKHNTAIVFLTSTEYQIKSIEKLHICVLNMLTKFYDQTFDNFRYSPFRMRFQHRSAKTENSHF